MSQYRLTALGRLELMDQKGNDVLRRLTQPKRLALLLFFAVAGPSAHRRDSLLGMFWPELDGADARSALRQAVHYLREQLGPEAIISRGPEELLLGSEVLSSDVAELELAAASARWSEVLQLHQGPLAPGFFCGGASADFDDWLERRRRELRRLAARAAREVASGGSGELSAAVDQVRRAIDQGSCDEGVVRKLMEAMARAGDTGGALRLYRHLSERLRRDLQIDPSAPTRQLADLLQADQAGQS